MLDALVNLKNLNLQGNPVAEKDKLAKKVIVNFLPSLIWISVIASHENNISVDQKDAAKPACFQCKTDR